MVRVTAMERVQAPAPARELVRVRVLVLAERGRLSAPSAIVRFAPATLQSLPSSSATPVTSCLEAAGAFCDSTFATPIRFHDENDPPVRLDGARADCAGHDVIRRREARGPYRQKWYSRGHQRAGEMNNRTERAIAIGMMRRVAARRSSRARGLDLCRRLAGEVIEMHVPEGERELKRERKQRN